MEACVRQPTLTHREYPDCVCIPHPLCKHRIKAVKPIRYAMDLQEVHYVNRLIAQRFFFQGSRTLAQLDSKQDRMTHPGINEYVQDVHMDAKLVYKAMICLVICMI